MASIRFISLFVPNLDAAATHYGELLQMSPSIGPSAVPKPHPFAARGPVVFELGDVALALYECDNQTTHPGDVGLGLECEVAVYAPRINAQGGHVFWGPRQVSNEARALAIGMMPDRHFFELINPISS